MLFWPRCWTLLFAFVLWHPLVCARADHPTEIGPARIGEVYAHAIGTSRRAQFSLIGNPHWLSISNEGVLTGIPDEQGPGTIQFTAVARWDDNTPPLYRSFSITILPFSCFDSGIFHWCDGPAEKKRPPQSFRFGFAPEQIQSPAKDGDSVNLDCRDSGQLLSNPNLSGACIVQFSRLRPGGSRECGSQVGEYGHFCLKTNRIVWGPPGGGTLKDSIVNAINGSKVTLSGSVLIRRHVPTCSFLSWSVVTQTVDSSNNLFYGPSDLTAFCADDETVLIVLPVHAIWANAYAIPANTNDPMWKPLSGPPRGHECWTGEWSKDGSPSQGIRPCDLWKGPPPPKCRLTCADPTYADSTYADEGSNWLLRRYYSRLGSWTYNRLTQPGVSQGSISISPIIPATKSTWDVQAYESTRLGPGWAGMQFTYERDRKAVDDFNSLTAALTYDFRVRNRNPHWFCVGTRGSRFLMGEECNPTGDGSVPAIFGLRPLEVSVRFGPEWAPASENIKGSFQPGASGAKQVDYVPRDLNLVGAVTMRVPMILNPVRANNVKRPEQFTFAPVVGTEGGYRVISHGIGTSCASQSPHEFSARGPCVIPPHWILRRVLGVDASARLPYNFTRSFLGDRPLTIDFSYRKRQQYFAEPFFDVSKNPFLYSSPEGVSAGGRSYVRITFIAPISAYLQARATWQRGALPPIFQFVGNEVNFGISFSNPGASEH